MPKLGKSAIRFFGTLVTLLNSASVLLGISIRPAKPVSRLAVVRLSESDRGQGACCYKRTKVFGKTCLRNGVSAATNTAAIIMLELWPCSLPSNQSERLDRAKIDVANLYTGDRCRAFAFAKAVCFNPTYQYVGLPPIDIWRFLA